MYEYVLDIHIDTEVCTSVCLYVWMCAQQPIQKYLEKYTFSYIYIDGLGVGSVWHRQNACLYPPKRDTLFV